jgi:hypothetical protein
MEQVRTQRQNEHRGGGGLPDGAADGLMATVTHWPYAETLPVANMTVGEVRQRYGERFDIDPRSHATLDGVDASSDTVIRAGQMLMFVRRAGEKG